MLDPIGSGLLVGGLSLLGGRSQNASNARIAAQQMNFEREEAALNRQFQSHLAHTAHEREVNDLRRAGLNPILSGTGGPGAPMAAGAKGSGAGIPAVNELGMAVSSALEGRRNYAEVKNMEETNKNIVQDTKLKLEQSRAAHESIYRTKWESDLTEEQFRTERARAEDFENRLPGSRTEANIDRSAYGQGLRYVDRIGQSIGSALGARRLFQQGPKADPRPRYRGGPWLD